MTIIADWQEKELRKRLVPTCWPKISQRQWDVLFAREYLRHRTPPEQTLKKIALAHIRELYET